MATEASKHGRGVRAAVVAGLGLLLWFTPPPAGLRGPAMHLVAIFAATIAGLVLQPLPQGAVVITGVALAALTGTLALGDALAGYADSTVWLIVVAFLLARGFVVTGLGRRIAFTAVRLFGGRVLGLAYALALADAALAPATPSNTARAGGILFPIVRSLAASLDRRAGAFLIFAGFQVNLVTSAMFLTAAAPNAMCARLAHDALRVEVTWMGWLRAACLPGLISLATLPFLIYLLLRPGNADSAEARRLATAELRKMGPIGAAERRMLLVASGALLLWAAGEWIGANATAVALAGLAALVVAGVLSWEDVLAERGAWDALVWFGGLVSLAGGLAKLGAIGVLAAALRGALAGVHSWALGFLLLVLAYVYSHYGMASMTAHATAFYVPLGLVGVSLGAPAALVALVLAFMNNLNAAMTTYGTGPAPIYYGSGYVAPATWWRCGFLVSVANLAIWLVVGGAWWKLIGLW